MRETGEPAPALAGTPLYLAPELLQGDEATIQSDVYSIGVLLYRMLTGSYPWCGRTVADLRIAHRCRSRVDVATARRDVPRRLARIVERALETDAERSPRECGCPRRGARGARAAPSGHSLKYAIAVAATLVLGGLLLAAGALSLHHQGTAAQTSAQPASEGPSIAVLPLQDLGSETGGEEFADGFTEELINALAADGHVQVRSRTSSFAFKNTQRDLQDVARQLKRRPRARGLNPAFGKSVSRRRAAFAGIHRRRALERAVRRRHRKRVLPRAIGLCNASANGLEHNVCPAVAPTI
jgi:serine/threonine protein kinase